LHYGDEKKDRYSRTLAHVYLPDGTNISNWLLEKGFARTMVFPPNIKLAHCYKKSELLAQQSVLRIWTLKYNKLHNAENLPRRVKGNIRLTGKVKKVIHHKKSIIIELDSTSKSHIQIKIRKKHFRYFKEMDTDKLWDKTIIVSGHLKNRRNKRTITLKHPSQLKVIALTTTKPTLKWSLKNEN
jgi:hypothetical protein